MNITNLDLWINQAIELFLYHYKAWLDWEASTVLVDSKYNIVAYWDNETENIDIIMYDGEHSGKFIIENWIPKETDEAIRFKPYTYRIFSSSTEKPKKGTKEWSDAVKAIKTYNINYFKN
jgi:hypothetical protein